MSWWRIVPWLLRPAKELIEVFERDGPSQAQSRHADRVTLSAKELAALQQLAAALQPRSKRTRWDSFVDGLNRAPRPLITLGVPAFLALAALDPPHFARIARAYQLMPDGFWALLGVVVAFYFGGRMQLKRQDLALREGALEVARELLALQRAARERPATPRAEPTPADAQLKCNVGQATRAHRVIEASQRQRERHGD